MTRRIIDLTLTITPKAAWTQWPRRLVNEEEPPVKIEHISTFPQDHIFYSRFEMATQSYTHIDAPSHFDPHGKDVDEVPVEQLVGEGVIIEMTHKKPGEAVTAQDLENSGAQLRPGDIAIIRTGWTDDAPFGEERYWREMIYLAEGVGEWLAGKKVKALVYDCYADPPPFYWCADGHPHPHENIRSPNHVALLTRGILLVTNCRNLRAIKQSRVLIVALPIKLKGTDGAPARVIAIEEDSR